MTYSYELKRLSTFLSRIKPKKPNFATYRLNCDVTIVDRCDVYKTKKLDIEAKNYTDLKFLRYL